MPLHTQNIQHLDGPVPRGPGLEPIVGAPHAHKVNLEKLAVWLGMCVVPWVIIAGIVWMIYG
jgi:hypothetical protein